MASEETPKRPAKRARARPLRAAGETATPRTWGAPSATTRTENSELARLRAENARLGDETNEALERETAIAQVLEAISNSPTDVDPVLDTISRSAARICDAAYSAVMLLEHDMLVAHHMTPGASPTRRSVALEGTVVGAAIRELRTVHVEDILATDDFPASRVSAQRTRDGTRSVLAVPLLGQGRAIGAIFLRRIEVRSFSEREIDLIRTFADQAVIAIESVRLFNETREKSGQLQVANQELQAASRHKSEFLANMSHELRTPLNAIIGFSDVLIGGMAGHLDEKQTEYLKDIRGSGRHLLSLINDILDLSKVEAGRMELTVSEFSFRAALSNAVTMIRERAAGHGIGLDLSVDGVDVISADERKVKQILFNLLSNAVKFTPDGGTISVRAQRQDSEMLFVTVRDTGVGIPKEDLGRIFEEFRQSGAASSRSAETEGTGLGLALTKSFVDLHGGRIWVESEVGKGSTFHFTLPLAPRSRAG